MIVDIADVLLPLAGEEVLDCRGKRLLPGLVDLHSHGCVGGDFSIADRTQLQAMRKYYASHGVTAVLATTMTMAKADYCTACTTLKAEIADPMADGCKLLGIYMEGPFLGEAKKGAHDAQFLSCIDADYFAELDELSGGNLTVIALDPDLDGATDLMRQLHGKKVFSMAHTACDYQTGLQAVAAGASQITHLFNAMNGLHHRDPSLFGVLQDRDIKAELISDGVHIHPAVVRMMFSTCADKLILISDSMAACGLGDGQYVLGGLDVTVKDGKALLKDGTIAGSTCNLFEMLKRAISFGVPMEQAVLAATKHPAEAIGMANRVGQLAVGRPADLLLVNDTFDLEGVWIDGKEYV